MTHSRDDNDLDVRDALRPGRLAMPTAVDARLQERLAGADARGGPTRARRRTVAAGLILAGVAVAVATAWGLDRDDPAAGPGRHAQDRAGAVSAPDTLQDPRPLPPQRGPAAQEPAVVDATCESAAATRAGAPILAVIQLQPALDSAPRRARILRWLAPAPASFPSEHADWPIRAVRTEGNPSDLRAFVDRAEINPGDPAAHRSWIVGLDFVDGDEATRALLPWKDGPLRGIPVPDGDPEPREPHHKQLLIELLSALESADGGLRRAAALALLEWDGPGTGLAGGPARDPDSLWAGLDEHTEPGLASTPLRLLDLSRDPDVAIRASLAARLPAAAGPAVDRALFLLLFDPVAVVRSAARRSLPRLGHADWAALLEGLDDTWWNEFTNPLDWALWDQRCREAAAAENITDDVGVWRRQLHKPRDDNHLLGALGLGTTGAKAAVEILATLSQHQDARVRIAAAGSRLRLDDDRAWALLRKECLSGSRREAAFAIDRIRGISRLEALDLLDECTESPDPVVRAMGIAGMRDLKPLAVHRVMARLADLADDPHPLVRACAATY